MSAAAQLRALHRPGAPLLLANAWDVASARVVEELGFPAVATSSAAIANSLGYPDGERISRREMLEVVARIVRAVRVPVTADMESGYGDDLEACARELAASGALGLNFEDSKNEAELIPLERQLERLARLRAAAPELVLNARCDAYLLPGSVPFDRWEEALRRGSAYRAAGADCIFLPGLKDLATIRRFLAASPGPLNILAAPGVPPVADLAAAGVARISLGSGTYRAALTAHRRLALELREHGTFSALDSALTYAEANALLRD
ncbi:MAG TPA: isocitrate lyase/phosphoenolpyruvate mutase family protein [Terriglobales bacterium]|nr:isocitrate lyase/phosphoenolpyruvate mutase family protein [Terriglobales bacterium]